MKKHISLGLACLCALCFVGCKAATPKPVDTIKGNLKTYYEMPDGTWKTDEHTYKYRLEISGRMNNAAKNSTFVYLSNLPSITFDEAWKAAGLSSNSEDYFAIEEALLVEMK